VSPGAIPQRVSCFVLPTWPCAALISQVLSNCFLIVIPTMQYAAKYGHACYHVFSGFTSYLVMCCKYLYPKCFQIVSWLYFIAKYGLQSIRILPRALHVFPNVYLLPGHVLLSIYMLPRALILLTTWPCAAK
jgi:hypothetical protein